MIPPWAVNASTALWGDDAEDFRPERWLQAKDRAIEALSAEGKEKKSTNYDFLTFLHGPRSCIGQSFAMGELACLVAAWVVAFDTRLRDSEMVIKVSGSITAKPKDGLYVYVKPIGITAGGDI